jgi:hypothetical protein
MNPVKPFDERRSAAIKDMLMDTVRTSPQRGAAVRRRGSLVAALVGAALLLAGGSAAVALNAKEIFAPVAPPPASPTTLAPASPSPTPTATTSPPPAPSAPASTIPLGCTDFAPSDGALSDRTGFYRVLDAAQLQAGVLSCQWNDFSQNGYLAMDAVADAERGAEDIQHLKTTGWNDLGLGDQSAWSCAVVAPGCTAEAVVGRYWVTVKVERPGLTSETGKAELVAGLSDIVAKLREHPDPAPRWTAPATSWDGRDCSALAGADVAAILGTPGIVGPKPVAVGAVSAIDAYGPLVSCRWSVPDDASTSPDQPRSVDVNVAPGSAWAWDRRELSSADVEDVTVRGAQRAQFVCFPSEGATVCQLDVVTDGSWLRVDSGAASLPGDRERFIAIAEAVIAAH